VGQFWKEGCEASPNRPPCRRAFIGGSSPAQAWEIIAGESCRKKNMRQASIIVGELSLVELEIRDGNKHVTWVVGHPRWTSVETLSKFSFPPFQLYFVHITPAMTQRSVRVVVASHVCVPRKPGRNETFNCFLCKRRATKAESRALANSANSM
jgi:hypothetical protein